MTRQGHPVVALESTIALALDDDAGVGVRLVRRKLGSGHELSAVPGGCSPHNQSSGFIRTWKRWRKARQPVLGLGTTDGIFCDCAHTALHFEQPLAPASTTAAHHGQR